MFGQRVVLDHRRSRPRSLTCSCGRAAAACAPCRLPAAVGSRCTSASMNGVAGPSASTTPAVASAVTIRQRRSVSIDEAGQAQLGGVAVEQRRQHLDVPRRQHRRAQRVDERQLVIRSGLARRGPTPAAGRRTSASRARTPSRARRRTPSAVCACSSSRCATPTSVSACTPPHTSATKSRARSSASRVISQAADHTSVRGSGSAMSAMRAQRGRQRLVVEPQRAVRQVVVVDQDQLAARNTLSAQELPSTSPSTSSSSRCTRTSLPVPSSS